MSRAALMLAFVVACGPKTPAPQEPVAEPTERVEAAPAEQRTFEIENMRLVLPSPIAFAQAAPDLLPESEAALEHILAFLNERADVTVLRIEGHTDGAGDEDDVMFSGERALRVGQWLMERGIACERLYIAGFGGTKPVADPSTPEGRSANRRIEVVVAELRGKPIGGMPLDGSAPAAIPGCT